MQSLHQETRSTETKTEASIKWFDSDTQCDDKMERTGFDDFGRLMIWLCLVGFWIAVAWVVVL